MLKPVNTAMLKSPKYQRGIIGFAAAGTMSGAKTIAGTPAGGDIVASLSGIARLGEYKLVGSGLHDGNSNIVVPCVGSPDGAYYLWSDNDDLDLRIGTVSPGSVNNYVIDFENRSVVLCNNALTEQMRGGQWINNGTAFVGSRYAFGTGLDIAELTNDGPAYLPGLDQLETVANTLSLAPSTIEPVDLCFVNGGLKLIVSHRNGGGASAKIVRYDLTVAYDISTAALGSPINQISINEVRGVQMSDDGTFMWITNDNTNRLEQYNLSTPYDLTTATLGSPIADNVLEVQDAALRTIATAGSIAPTEDFTKVYITWFQNSISATNVFTIEYQKPDIGGWTNAPFAVNQYIERTDSTQYDHDELRGMLWNDDGTRLYTVGTADNRIRYNHVAFSTPYAVESRNPGVTGSPLPLKAATTAGLGGDPMDMAWNSDGTSMFIADYTTSGGIIRELQNTGAPYNPNDGELVGSPALAVFDPGQTCRSIDFSADGTVMMYVSNTTRDIYTRTLSTPWDITTAGAETTLTNPAPLLSAKFSPDGHFIVGVNQTTRDIERMHLAIPYDLTSQPNATIEEQTPLTTALTQGTEGYVVLSPDGSVLTVSHFNASTGYLSDYLAP